MTVPLLSELKLLTLAQLEKAAIDSGFDVVGGLANSLMAFRSSQSPLRIWLGIIEADASTSQPIIGLSMSNVAAELHCPEITAPVNIDGCHAWITARDFVDLDRVLGRAFALSRALPNQLLETWQSQLKTLSVTERESLVRQRVGQDLFREGLSALWAGRCAITGVDEPALLRASHAKPWKDASDSERLDVYNGLLLAAHLDAAFDRGLASVDLVMFLLLTGARIGEASALTWDRVNLDEAWWHIPDPKNRNPVWMPLSSQALELLKTRQRVKGSNFVFASWGKAGHIRDPRDTMNKVSEIAGLHLSPHDLRRTFTTIGLANCSLDLYKVELLTNHVPKTVTERHYLETQQLQYLLPEAQRIADWIEAQAVAVKAQAAAAQPEAELVE